MTKIYSILIDEILTTIKKIKKLINEKTYDEFYKDYHLVDDTIRYLNIIGEACKHIPDEIKTEYEDIPWDILLDLRNILEEPEHIKQVWNIATVKLLDVKPILKDVIVK